MKNANQALVLSITLLVLLLSGCAPASMPTLIPSTQTPTFIPKPTSTLTPIPSPTPVPAAWDVTAQIDAPLEFSEERYGYSYRWEEIPGSAIVLDTDTRWTTDLQVNELPGAKGGETSTGIILQGYTDSGDAQRLDIIYGNGHWWFGYMPSTANSNRYTFSQDFQFLDNPNEHFEISLNSDHDLAIYDKNGFMKGLGGAELFNRSQVITANLLIGPRRTITVSKLTVEQLRVPSDSMASAISLEKPYVEDFESLEMSDPTEIQSFVFPERIDIFNIFSNLWEREFRMAKFASWAVDSRARSGKVSINAIPHGNPVSKDITPISIALLKPKFDIRNQKTVSLNFWTNSTSNPRVSSVHNCDSDLAVYSRLDGEQWVQHSIRCGEHKKETHGWQEQFLDFDVSGRSTIQFAFAYEVQHVDKLDQDAYYLIDDLKITGK